MTPDTQKDSDDSDESDSEVGEGYGLFDVWVLRECACEACKVEGVGAHGLRRLDVAHAFASCGVLRGNASEILSLSGEDGAAKGVDSTKGGLGVISVERRRETSRG